MISFAQPVETEHVEAELISEVSSIRAGTPFWVALRLDHEEEWHTYWRNDGDAGLATKIEWNLPEGFEAGEIHWPYPKKIIISGLANYGYENEVLLLAEITPPEKLPENEIKIEATAKWLVCRVDCIPGSADLEMTLPVKNNIPKVNNEWTTKFANAREKLPITSTGWNFEASLNDTIVTLHIQRPEWSNQKFNEVVFFPYETGIFINAGIQNFSTIKSGLYTLEIPLDRLRIKDPEILKGILISEKGWCGEGSEKSMEFNVPVGMKSSMTQIPASNNDGLILALVFAFVGGIILNLMPCVLPVLSIKILGFVQQAGKDKTKIIKHGGAFTAGVLFSFWILAGLLLVLRAGGEQLGWGFQLQSPTFIVILSIFLFLFALSLFGVFEIGTSLSSLGSKVEKGNGNGSAFLSGVAATVLATPCTAPFMGSALGFAITQPPFVTMSIFTSLAIGMAFPYLLLSIFPQWLKFLPKPGNWMESLKQFMGFLLIATIIWLAWVLSIQAGADALIILFSILLFSAIAAWIYGRWGNVAKSGRTRLIALVISLAILLPSAIWGLNLINQIPQYTSSNSSSSAGLNWQKFSPEIVNKLRNEGKHVFVDFTAAWCLTCKVNEKVALDTEEVINKFDELNVAAVKADWTNRDDAITEALAEYGRNSVPLYVLYNADSSVEPKFLPEILTPGIVIEALENLN